MYSTRPRKEKAKEERDIYGNTIDEEIELQGMSRERRAKHNREKLQQRLQAGSHLSRCLPVLELLKLRPDAAWFLNPVSADDVPDYAEVIERPMDYSTIEGKLKGGAYGDDTLAFAADVRLVYSNAFKYNYDPNNQCHQAAKESLREFEKTFSSAMRAPENDGTMGPPSGGGRGRGRGRGRGGGRKRALSDIDGPPSGASSAPGSGRGSGRGSGSMAGTPAGMAGGGAGTPASAKRVRNTPVTGLSEAERSSAQLAALAEYLEACGGSASMVDGWYTKTEYRKEGATAGTYDSYFFSPQGTSNLLLTYF